MIDLTAEINNEQIKKQLEELRNTAHRSVKGTIDEFSLLDAAVLRFSANLERMGENADLGALEKQIKQVRQIFSDLDKSATSEGATEKATEKVMRLATAIDALNDELERTETAGMGTTKGFNMLQFQIQQVARELPALAYGPQVFFSALSNNLPMLAEEIARTRKELGGFKPVLKQIIASVVSWQTLLLAGVTIFTMYGKEITQWVGALFNGRKTLDEMAAAQKSFNDTMRKGAIEAQGEVTKFRLLYKTATDTATAMERRTKAVDEIRKLYPSYLQGLSDEQILIGKAKGAYEEITASIYQAAKARAALSKITELEAVGLAVGLAPEEYKNRAEEAKNRREAIQASQQSPFYDEYLRGDTDRQTISRLEKAERKAFSDWIDTQGEKFKWIKEQGIKTFDELNSYIATTSQSLVPIATNALFDPNAEGQAAKEEQERRKQAAEEVIKEIRIINAEAQQAEIDAMAEGLPKQLAQINYNYDKKIEAIRIKEAELRATNGGNLPNGMQPRIDALIKSYNAQRAVEVAKATERAEAEAEEARKKELSAMYEYIKEYGTLLERKKAITEEYNKKIAEAQNKWDKKRFEAERDALISDIDEKIFKESIDWEAIFGDISGKSLEGLKAMRNEIRKLLSSSDSFTPTDLSKLYEQYNKIGEAIEDVQFSFAKFVGYNDESIDKAKRLREEYEDLKNILDDLLQKQDEAEFRQFETQSALSDFVFQKTGKQVRGNESFDFLNSLFSGSDSDTQSQFNTLFQNNAQASQQLTDITSKVGQAGDAMGKAGSALKGVGGGAADTIEMINKIIHGINDNVQSMVHLVEELGVEETDFGRFTGEFAKSSQYATKGWESLKKGDFVGVVSNVLGSLRTLGNSLGELGIKGFGASNPDLYRDIERLTAVNEELTKAISLLTEVIDDVPILEAVDEYARQMQWFNEAIANTQKMMLDSLNAYNNGFLGIGGKGSSRKRVDEGVSVSEWQRISDIIGRSVYSATEFFSISSEEMLEVLRSAPDLYAKIKDLANDGYADAGKFMDEYIEFAKQREELEMAYRETLTDVSFDEIRNEFKGVLLDMETDAEDFAKTFNKRLANSIAEALMKEKYDRQIKELFGRWGEFMESGGSLSDEEIRQLQEDKNRLFEQMKAEREGLKWLIDEGAQGQNATAKGFQTMDQETGNELNGRMTDIQGKVTNIRDVVLDMMQTSKDSLGISTDIRDIAIEIRLDVSEIKGHTEALGEINSRLGSIDRTLKEQL